MGNPARVGVESTDHRSVCAFSVTEGAPQCTDRAALHIRVISIEYGEVCMASCTAHAPIARAVGIHRDEHAFTGYCGLPGALWYPDHCDLDVADPSWIPEDR